MFRWVLACALVAQILFLPAPMYAGGSSLTDAAAALQSGDFITAQVLYEDLIAAEPGLQEAWLGLARAYAGRENWPLAVKAYDQAATLGDLPGDAQAALAAAKAVVKQLNKDQPQAAASAPTAPDTEPEQWPAPEAAAEPAPALEPASSAPPAETPAASTNPSTIELLPFKPAAPVKPRAEIAPEQRLAVEVQPGTLEQIAPSPAEAESPAPLPEVNAFRRSGGGTPVSFVLQGAAPAEGGAPADEPTTAEGWLAKARDHVAHNEWVAAVSAYEQYFQYVKPELEVRLEYADALREAGELERAEREYNRILHDDSENVPGKLGLAKVLGMTERVEEAMQLLDTMYLDQEANIEALLVKAWIYYMLDDPATALNMIGEVLARDPQNPDALEGRKVYGRALDEQRGLTGPGPLPSDPARRADVLYTRGDYEEALRDYEDAVALNPDLAGAWKRLAQLYGWADRWEEAADAYEHYLGLVPDDFEARLGYAQALLWSGQKNAAREELDSLVTDPDIPVELYGSALLNYATALSSTGNTDRALRYFQEAMVMDPDNSEARTGYAGALAGSGQYGAAQDVYKNVLREDPTNDAAKVGLAQSYAWQGQGAAARRYYNTVGMESNYYSASLIGAAYTYLWEGDLAQARRLAGQAAQQDPANPDLAELYRALGMTPDPQMAVTWRQSHDSEDNDYRGVLTELTVPLSPGGATLYASHEDFKLDNSTAGLQSDGTDTRVALTVPLSPDVRVRGSADYLELKNGADPGASQWDYEGSMEVDVSPGWTAGAGLRTGTLRDTPQLARNQVEYDEYFLSSNWRVFDDQTRLYAYYARADFNDTNSRRNWTLNLQRSAVAPALALFNYGVAYRELDYVKDLNNGYWDPNHYRYGEVYLDWVDQTTNDLHLDGSVGYGMDKESGRSLSGAYRYALGLRSYLFGNRLLVRAGYSSSDAESNAATGPGYKARSWYLKAEFKF